MEEDNLVKTMLSKGDEMKEQYRNFDFSTLDSTQHRYLNRLSLFSKYRDSITKRYNYSKVSREVKIMYLDQHSMKLGNSIFYNLEAVRQDYI
jgi:hypothetical protein